MYTVEQFKKAFDDVFDSKGEVRPCGRVACKKLISMCIDMDNSQVNYGDTKTGYMNVANIKNFYNSIISDAKV